MIFSHMKTAFDNLQQMTYENIVAKGEEIPQSKLLFLFYNNILTLFSLSYFHSDIFLIFAQFSCLQIGLLKIVYMYVSEV